MPAPQNVVAELERKLNERTVERDELLEQQIATDAILKVIAGSRSDAQPVFDAIAASANRLIAGFSATVMRFIGDGLHLVAFTRTNAAADEALKASFPRPLAEFPPFELVRGGKTVQFVDTEAVDVPPVNRELARLRGYRSMLFTPLMSNSGAIGILSVTRVQPGKFAKHHVQLLKTFADQAVIAIENAHLFNETREALERQTATAEILKVIASSPNDVQPVFDAIAERSNRLLGGHATAVYRFAEDAVHLMAFTPVSPEADAALKASFPRSLASAPNFKTVQNGEVVQISDALAEDALDITKYTARVRGFRSLIFMPLSSHSGPIGAISVTRKEVGTFSAHHVQLLRTFADQAVIAIQNARMFKEVEARTEDLRESLQQQTATSEVLKVISRSAFDLDAVMNTLARSASELCAADLSALFLRDGDVLVVRGSSDVDTKTYEFLKQIRVPIDDQSSLGRATLHGTIANIPDFESDPSIKVRTFQQALGFAALLIVPLMREGGSVGAIALCRNSVGTFSQRQVELVQTFADQAVIAIENVRLFDEVQARTDDLRESLQQQTATADVLKVISRSAFDLQTVLDALVESAAKLCEAEKGVIFLREANHYKLVSNYGFSAEFEAFAKANPFPADGGSTTSRAGASSGAVQVVDVLADDARSDLAREYQRLAGFRTNLGVPLRREGETIGVFTLTRQVVRAFTKRQIELAETFADQAVIAIANVRLFDEVQARTKELAASLEDLRAAQDRLVQTEKLASLGHLTAGIAHEIKNPLNFVNNFAALSAELTDELNDVLKPAVLDGKMRDEVDELTQMLKDNLTKVVQHGKRADSIVKNMLLHSREGSGEHRPADINALLDESLNLAYHGARAEKADFNITLQRYFDPDAGAIDVFPQDITRAFINLISNGFYAASEHKAENGKVGFEPVLSAATRNLGSQVEIRIRDNGTGIPAEVKEKIFNPFFTTKPAGEGTGLGLSMSHDIIVKQHGGTIDVETEPGQFTEFKIVLPRTSQVQDRKRGQT